MDKTAVTEHPIHPLIARRWSSRSFDDRRVSDDALASLLEAARWAPSSFNAQPWSFIVARREDAPEFEKLLGCLVEANRIWAHRAPVLMLTVARMEHNGQPNRHALHDVGMAAANLTLQATHLGLNVYLMAGFDTAKAREVFAVPAGHEPVTAIAVGYRGDAQQLPQPLRDLEAAPRTRKPFADLVYQRR